MRIIAAGVICLQILLCGVASAGDLTPDLRTLIEHFEAGRRVAMGYLRTQNGDLGAFEIERLRDRLGQDRSKLAAATPADAGLVAALDRTQALVAASLKAVDDNDLELSRATLEGAGQPIVTWRKANGIRMFSDCIEDICTTYDRLDGDRSKPPDLSDGATAARVIAMAKDVVAALDRCDVEAAPELRGEPEFRRLFDGMRASLRQIPDAVGARDDALLHRLLIEQRSFEQLLRFRFG
jgi:hypothetical protein